MYRGILLFAILNLLGCSSPEFRSDPPAEFAFLWHMEPKDLWVESRGDDQVLCINYASTSELTGEHDTEHPRQRRYALATGKQLYDGPIDWKGEHGRLGTYAPFRSDSSPIDPAFTARQEQDDVAIVEKSTGREAWRLEGEEAFVTVASGPALAVVSRVDHGPSWEAVRNGTSISARGVTLFILLNGKLVHREHTRDSQLSLIHGENQLLIFNRAGLGNSDTTRVFRLGSLDYADVKGVPRLLVDDHLIAIKGQGVAVFRLNQLGWKPDHVDSAHSGAKP